MLDQISDLPSLEKRVDPEAILLLAGFCWSEKQFRIWILYFNQSLRRFTFRRATPWRGSASRGKVLAVVGDEVGEAKDRLISMLREQRTLTVGGFNLEPLQVLKSMALGPKNPSDRRANTNREGLPEP